MRFSRDFEMAKKKKKKKREKHVLTSKGPGEKKEMKSIRTTEI